MKVSIYKMTLKKPVLIGIKYLVIIINITISSQVKEKLSFWSINTENILINAKVFIMT